jgi:y4mF family transcriptional regulator
MKLSLSQFIKEKRKSLGMTQEALSFKAGVGLRFVRELEQGKPTLQMNKVNQVLKLFGTELGPVELRTRMSTDEEG